VAFSKDFSRISTTIPGDGVELVVTRSGDEDKPTIVFVHGYPDTHEVWMPTIARLVDDFHCIAYDVRGAGESAAPESREGYRMRFLVDDLIKVADWFSPNAPIHLVGHDWGSVQGWELVLRASAERALRGRIATYTSISGPSIGHVSAWAHHMRRASWRGYVTLARQAVRSSYIPVFRTPIVGEAVVRATIAGPQPVRRALGFRRSDPTIGRTARNGLNIYRANGHRPPGERTPLQTDLPVQLIVPTRDPFLRPALYDDLPLWCSDLTRHDIDAGHWVQLSHPDQVAGWVAEHVQSHVA
jgi:pimeloyl-ACP methyl ester carboxylesterase